MVCRVFGDGPAKAPYYGLNVSPKAEPIDQLDVLLLSKRMGCDLTLFIAGKYGLLNRKSGELEGACEFFGRKEKEKARLLRAASDAFGLTSRILVSSDLWSTSFYWKAALELGSVEGIIRNSGSGVLFGDIPEYLISSAREFSEFRERFSMVRASDLYVLLEVAEAMTLPAKYGPVDCKIGPMTEERYDRFIRGPIDVIQLEQPLDLASRNGEPKPVIPYIEKDGEARVTFDDGKRAVEDKIFRSAQRNLGVSLYLDFNGARVFNPFMRLAVLGVLAAEATSNLPVRFGTSRIAGAQDLLSLAQRTDPKDYIRWSGVVTELVWGCIIEKVRAAITIRALRDSNLAREPYAAGSGGYIPGSDYFFSSDRRWYP